MKVMSKKLLFISILALLFLDKNVSGQRLGNKWWIVQDLPDKIVYIDTSSIRATGNQISVWSLVLYRSPIRLNAFKEEISRIKSQYLFNKANDRYSVIGTLYYNRRSKIVGESVSPAVTGSGERFTLVVQPGSPIEKVLEKTEEYLTAGIVLSEPSQYLDNIEDNQTEGPVDETVIIPPIKEEESKPDSQLTESRLPDDPLLFDTFENAVPKDTTDDSSVVVKVNNEPEVQEENIDPTIIKLPSASDILADNEDTQTPDGTDPGERRIYDPVSGKYITASGNRNNRTTPRPKEEKTSTPESTNKKPPSNSSDGSDYNGDSERNVKGNIWSDGNLYCIQFSSWRTKSVADNEVRKLKSNGHNAFVFQKYIQSKRATYNRVRVGYFNTLAEAETYLRNMR